MVKAVGILCALIWFFPIQPYIYTLGFLKKWNPEQSSWNYVIGFGDFHDKFHPESRNHRYALESFISSYSPEKLHIVVEDLSSPNNQNVSGCKSFSLCGTKGVLAQMGKYCRDRGYSVNNIEYRYARALSLSSLYKGLQDSDSCRPALMIHISDLLHEITNTYHDLTSVFCDHQYGFWYKSSCRKVLDRIVPYNFHAYTHMDVASFCNFYAHIMQKPFSHVVQDLLTCDSELIDCRMLQAVKESDKQVTIIIGGGTHIERVLGILSGLEYTWVHKSSNRFSQRVSTTNAAFSEYHVHKPMPLDLGRIITMKYIEQ